jgi:hypothetical protein
MDPVTGPLVLRTSIEAMCGGELAVHRIPGHLRGDDFSSAPFRCEPHIEKLCDTGKQTLRSSNTSNQVLSQSHRVNIAPNRLPVPHSTCISVWLRGGQGYLAALAVLHARLSSTLILSSTLS